MPSKRMVSRTPKKIPQDNCQRVSEENNVHVYVWALIHLQNDTNTAQMGK